MNSESWLYGNASFDELCSVTLGIKKSTAYKRIRMCTVLLELTPPWPALVKAGLTKTHNLCNAYAAANISAEEFSNYLEKCASMTCAQLDNELQAKKHGTQKPPKRKFIAIDAEHLAEVDAAVKKAKSESGAKTISEAFSIVCNEFLGGISHSA